jgi:hypothetical protein
VNIYLLLFGGVILLSCCSSKKSKKSPRLSGIFDYSVGYIERTDQKRVVNLWFKTTQGAHCEILATPTISAFHEEKYLPCDATAQKEHSYSIDNVDPATLLEFKITLWLPGYSKAEGEEVIISENSSGLTFIGGLDKSTLFKDLLVTKINLPLGEGILFRKEISSSPSFEEISAKLLMPEGCFDSELKNDLLIPSSESHEILNLGTLGFADLKTKIEDGKITRMAFDSYPRYGTPWEWFYRYQNRDYRFQAASPGKLDSLEIQSQDLSIVGETDLNRQAIEFKQMTIDSNLPLLVKWKISGSQSISYLTVKIRNRFSTETPLIFCAFASHKGAASIPQNLLKNLADGAHFIETSMVEYSIKRPYIDHPNWVIASSDWRIIVGVKK